MHIINPNDININSSGCNNNNGSKLFTERDTEETRKRRHYAAIKVHAETLLKMCNTDIELRNAIINLYHSKLREHQVEITAHPERSVNYLLACLEIFQVCLQHVFTAIQAQKDNLEDGINAAIQEVILENEKEDEKENEKENEDKGKK
jgi:hypothetical protein